MLTREGNGTWRKVVVPGMSDRAECVRRLAETAGISPGRRRVFDWAAIEEDLGLRLPSDYKVLAEWYPVGWFRLFAMLRLPDVEWRFLSEYAVSELNFLREIRESGESSFPYPVYPEPGGVLPWGSIRSPGLAYWLTGPGDPDGWPVVAATDHGDHWERFDGPVCEFLTEVAAARYDASGFEDQYKEQGDQWIHLAPRPVFTPFPSPAAPQASAEAVLTGPVAEFWPLQVAFGRNRPVNEIAVLHELIGPAPTVVPEVDWAGVHARLGFRLPADYREFIDTYGPGTLGDITIMAPGQPAGTDLFALLERKHAQVRGLLRDPRVDPPYYPEPGGTVSWGETADGRTCAWAPVGADCGEWIATLISPTPTLAGYSLRGQSFSTMLTEYIRQNPSTTMLEHDPAQGPVTFTPYTP
jgi:hypothetical protein